MALYKDKKTSRKRKQQKKIFVSIVALALVVTMGVSIWAIVDKMRTQQTVAPSVSSEQSDSSSSESSIPEPTSVRVMVAGDNLIHSRIYMQAAEKAGGDGYVFSYTYQHVAPLIAQADFGVINQETPLAASKPPSNWPLFNTPTQQGIIW